MLGINRQIIAFLCSKKTTGKYVIYGCDIGFSLGLNRFYSYHHFLLLEFFSLSQLVRLNKKSWISYFAHYAHSIPCPLQMCAFA